MKRVLLIAVVGMIAAAGQPAEGGMLENFDGPLAAGWVADGTSTITTHEWHAGKATNPATQPAGVPWKTGGTFWVDRETGERSSVFTDPADSPLWVHDIPYSAPMNLERLEAFEKLLPETLSEEELQFLIRAHDFEATQYPVYANWTPAYQPVYPYIYELLNRYYVRQPFGEYVFWHLDVAARSFDARSSKGSFERIRKILSDTLPEYKDSPAFDDECGCGSPENIRGLRYHMWQALDKVGSASLSEQAMAMEAQLKGELPDDTLPETKGPEGAGLESKVWDVPSTLKRRMRAPNSLFAQTRLLDLLAKMVLHETNQDSTPLWSDSDYWRDWVNAAGPLIVDDPELQFVPVYERFYKFVTEGLVESPAKSVQWHLTILEKCGDPQLRQWSRKYLSQVLPFEIAKLLPNLLTVRAGRVPAEIVESVRKPTSQWYKGKPTTKDELARHWQALHSLWWQTTYP